MRISYDTAAEALGSPETVMAYSQLGKVLLVSPLSPDGRYLLCVLCDRTTFSVYQNSADLYLFDLESKKWRRLDAVNSDFVSSFPAGRPMGAG